MKRTITAALSSALICAVTVANAGTIAGDVFHRSTARSFTSQTLTTQDIDLLLRSGFSAPSAVNQRALEYIVLSTRQEVDRLAQAMPEQRSLHTATCVIVIVGNNQKAKAPDLLPMDAGLSAQAIITEAGRLNYATNVMALWPSEKRRTQAKTTLQIPSTAIPLLMIAAGKPAADAVSSASQNNYQPQHIHHGSW